jgi:diguanylate cyclase
LRLRVLSRIHSNHVRPIILPVTAGPLLEALPDLVVLVRRDGTVISHGGGKGFSSLALDADSVGKPLDEVWPEAVAVLLKQLTRRAIATRASAEQRFEQSGLSYDARVSAQGPDRALCVIRPVLVSASVDALDATVEQRRPQLDRRGFLRRFKDTMSLAALSEKPVALAVIQIDGMTDVAQAIDGKIAEQLMSAVILRLSPEGTGPDGQNFRVFIGQLSDSLLALVLETSDRQAINTCVSNLCASLREPIRLGDAEFHLAPYAGVAMLGRDATSPKTLLDHARAAASHAQRSGSLEVGFFSDTLRVRSLARLDIARELREAIANRDIRLRYIGRHDLTTGRLCAWLGYLRWIHPIRGEVHPVEFLRVAETTGLATALSRAVLECLREDFIALAPQWDADVRISFGALRHHILHDDFVADIARLVRAGAIPPERLELRVAEKTFIACDMTVLAQLRQLGVQLVVDEVGRGLSSLTGLARAPIWGLQLDRACVTASRSDAVALKVCSAAIAVANALGLPAMASGVDEPAQRKALLAFGCHYGSGDLYRDAVPEVMRPYRLAASG